MREFADGEAFFGLQVAFAAEPVFHGWLKAVEWDVVSGFEKAIGDGQSVVEDSVVGEVAHGEIVDPVDGAGGFRSFGIYVANREFAHEHMSHLGHSVADLSICFSIESIGSVNLRARSASLLVTVECTPARSSLEKEPERDFPKRDARSSEIMNRNHLKMAVGTALLSLCACAAFGQAPPPGPPDQGGPPPRGERGGGPERQLRMLTQLLTLTPDQQTGVKAVLEQQNEQLRALRNKAQSEAADGNTQEAMQTRRSQVEAIRNESNTKITALLDENQKKTFADWTAKRKAEMERRRQQGGEAAPPPPTLSG